MLANLAAAIVCPSCGEPNQLDADDCGLTCAHCGWKAGCGDGVVDLLARAPAGAAAPQESQTAEIVDALIAKMNLQSHPGVRDGLMHVLSPVKETGDLFLDAEEALFVDRFEIKNVNIRLTLGPLYSAKSVGVGENFYVAARIRNDGPFPLSSKGVNPFLLSYHWYQDGECRDFEGVRSALPLELAPGREVTTLVSIVAPSEPGEWTLRLTPLVEMVAWLDEAAIDLPLTVGVHPTPLPDGSGGQSWTAALDSKLAAAFLAERLPLGADSTIVEIGGGISPAVAEALDLSAIACPTLINCDVSARVLRLAVILAGLRNQAMVNARFDACDTPFRDGVVDAVVFCRSLHHFPDLYRVLGEAIRILKPGGSLFFVCEPVGNIYDEMTVDLIQRGVNEQIFPLGAYEAMAERCGLALVEARNDWGFSFKARFRKP